MIDGTNMIIRSRTVYFLCLASVRVMSLSSNERRFLNDQAIEKDHLLLVEDSFVVLCS